ncbi:MAG TPA: hypothetical protein VFC89_01180 [Oscillospiraceae bacterium]|nr:hypothetical protein [Oscillospiraceae bacterium]
MKRITNGAKKLVCKVDQEKKLVEIKSRGQKTVISFEDGGAMKVVNSSEKVGSVF